MASTIYQARIFHGINYYRQYILGIIAYLLLSVTASAQSGLKEIIVEKIPVSAEAKADDPGIPEDAYAYRVFVEMDTAYELQAIYSLETHETILETSTQFYNNADFGATSGGDILSALLESFPSLAFDSYITINAATNNMLGVMTTEDTVDGTVDGMVSGSSLPLQTLGANFDVAFGTESYPGIFSTFSGIYSVIGGESGPTPTNKVLIGQFTTDGEFSFELNVQIRKKGTTEFEQYVARDPLGQEILFEALIYPGNLIMSPTVTISSPASGESFMTSETITITADASDSDGSVDLVEFFAGELKLGEDNTSPYQWNWSADEPGSFDLSAVATDNDGLQTTSGVVTVTVDEPTGFRNPDNDRSISVFPNPVKDKITIEFSGMPNHATFQADVMSVQGGSYIKQEIYISDNAYSTTIDISTLPNGVYIIRLVDENEQALYKKIIKN